MAVCAPLRCVLRLLGRTVLSCVTSWRAVLCCAVLCCAVFAVWMLDRDNAQQFQDICAEIPLAYAESNLLLQYLIIPGGTADFKSRV